MLLLPLGLLGWLGARIIRSESAMLTHRFDALLKGRLREISQEVTELIEERERSLLAATDGAAATPEAMRRLVRSNPEIRQAFLLDAAGRLAFPVPGHATADERSFLLRTAGIWADGEGFVRPSDAVAAAPPVQTLIEPPVQAMAQPTMHPQLTANLPVEIGPVANPSSTQQQPLAVDAQSRTKPRYQRETPTGNVIFNPVAAANQQDAATVKGGKRRVKGAAGRMQGGVAGETAAAPAESADPDFRTDGGGRGWYTWYAGRGLHLIFWRQLADGRVLGMELDRVRLMAEVVGRLPMEREPPAGRHSGVALADARGAVICQWGDLTAIETVAPRLQLHLAAPLSAWTLNLHVQDRLLENPYRNTFRYTLLGVLIPAGVALLVLGVTFYRESSREMRDAAQRVSFVNQVSHELKTPLTNIRLYAELLGATVDEEDATSRRNLSIIISESQRLSRLIGNVLTFGRQRQQRMVLRPVEACPDTLIREILQQFGPALADAGIAGTFSGGAPDPAMLDADAFGRILMNLISNVEKYAAAGGRVAVTSSREGDTLAVSVRDFGPGIPSGERERVFQPFHRVSNRLTDGVAGTGIGLTISRHLARLHGGDLELLAAEPGALFRFTVHAPRTKDTA